MIGRNWWDILPKSPVEVITRSIETPALGAGGAGAIIPKTFTKILPLLAAGGAGAFLASMFGGGGTQEQEQEITQTPEVTTTVTPTVDPEVTTTVTPTVDPEVTTIVAPVISPEISVIDSTVSGGIGTTTTHEYITTHTPTTTITKTVTITPTKTVTITPTTTSTFAGQEATAEQGTDFVTIALIAAAGLVGYMLLKKE